MSAVLLYVATGFGLVYALWLFYLAVMSLYRAHTAGTLSPWARRFGIPLLGLGYLLDFLANVLVLSFVMLELPREWVVTARLRRHKASGSGWRFAVASWICTNLLDAFDPSGCHCK